LRDDGSNDILRRAVFGEEFFWFVGGEPLVQKGELGIVGGCRGERDLMSMERSFDDLIA
jgi:hypothetical protein